MSECENILIREIKVSLDADEKEIFASAVKKVKGYISPKDIVSMGIYRKSIDARHRDNIRLVYTVNAKIKSGALSEKCPVSYATHVRNTAPVFTFGSETLESRPLIAGFGPAGMFCALVLAEQGYKPIVIERGGNVEERVAKVDFFYKTGILDCNTNIQFGAGGAGTFSDGKLVTRINDPKCDYVINTFHQFGAPENILTAAKPHIGTDILRNIVSNIELKIKELGGEVLYNTKFESLKTDSMGRANAVVTNRGEIPCGALIMAIGHSARDTYGYLKGAGFDIIPKPISVGVRIEHLQNDIDNAMYGEFAGHPKLGHAEYNLSKRTEKGAVYTFCMCPGGEVMAAASEEGRVVTNGMSRYARNGANANAAVVVSVSPENPLEFQRQIEENAFIAGGGNFNAPVQTVGDFLSDKLVSLPKRIVPTYMNGRVKPAMLKNYLPKEISDMLKIGLLDFNNKISGFAAPDAILTGFETRTSAPYRIKRSEAFTALGFDNIYPIGEGAGYAGGITSAALDGINCAMAVISRYAKPL